MKKLLTILVLFSLIGLKSTTANAYDYDVMSKLNSIERSLSSLESDVAAIKKAINGPYGNYAYSYEGIKQMLTRIESTLQSLRR